MKTTFIIIFLHLALLSYLVLSNTDAWAGELSCPNGMTLIKGGTYRMGDNHSGFVEEKVVEDVSVKDFCIDTHEVSNAQFAEFIAATGYKTVAERPLSLEQFPDLPDRERASGSLVFIAPKEGVLQVPYLSWWHWIPGANWQHPQGPESSIIAMGNYPVVHVAYEDAEAYANWAGKQLPTEAQWEYAARGGRFNTIFTWGNQYSPKQANTWQGKFPFVNQQQDGFVGIAPVGSFPPNGFGLFDMTGNVWEWTADWFRIDRQEMEHSFNPLGSSRAESYDPKKHREGAMHVIKGGSYLCAKNYCSRYRPVARESQAPDTGTSHIGFRLVLERGIDRNYGGALIIFDRLFGTFTEENLANPPIYGLTKPVRSHNPIIIALHEWARMFHDMQMTASWRDRLAIALGSPSDDGWAKSSNVKMRSSSVNL